jgi:hypothetical protein
MSFASDLSQYVLGTIQARMRENDIRIPDFDGEYLPWNMPQYQDRHIWDQIWISLLLYRQNNLVASYDCSIIPYRGLKVLLDSCNSMCGHLPSHLFSCST